MNVLKWIFVRQVLHLCMKGTKPVGTWVSLNQIVTVIALAEENFRGLLSLTEKLLYSEIFDSISIMFLLERY